MSDRFNIPKSISKTALDSQTAKLSAIMAGWLSSDSPCGNKDGNILDDYTRLLEKIHDGIEGQSRRRQTPLVNAGYAARIAVMTYIVERWIDSVVSRQNNDDRGVNVVALGCGLDALGLWTRHVLDNSLKKYPHASNQTLRLNVYEIDAWANCVTKQHALERSGILQECRRTKRDDDGTKDSFCVMVQGTINKISGATDGLPDYHLIAMDLRDMRSDSSLLTNALDYTGFDRSQPTLVLSELVLAYIGYESANRILHSIARDFLCGNDYSIFACLEPKLPTLAQQHDLTNKKFVSVRESYAKDYTNQFVGKLNRGTSSAEEESFSLFHQLGSNEETIIARFISCGFSTANIGVASLRKAVAKVACTRRDSNAPRFLYAKEPFDEHAALALNLDCYVVACAFNASKNGIRDLFPWLVDQWMNDFTTIEITPITDSRDDTLVGELYDRLYTHLYKTYPAIRKMVKSALKTDLRADSSDGTSAVGNRYKAKGGEFWIARDIESSEIVGCIGIRQRKPRENDVESDRGEASTLLSVVEYEVQRLAVDDQRRGNGIGKRLLNAVYEFSLQQLVTEAHKQNDAESKKASVVKLWAATPDILVAANNLYNAFGFVSEESFEGGLTMNIYCKTCSIT